jgi:hypothetical protein
LNSIIISFGARIGLHHRNLHTETTIIMSGAARLPDPELLVKSKNYHQL